MTNRTVQFLTFVTANLLYWAVLIWSAINRNLTREILMLAACFMMLMAIYMHLSHGGK